MFRPCSAIEGTGASRSAHYTLSASPPVTGSPRPADLTHHPRTCGGMSVSVALRLSYSSTSAARWWCVLRPERSSSVSASDRGWPRAVRRGLGREPTPRCRRVCGSARWAFLMPFLYDGGIEDGLIACSPPCHPLPSPSLNSMRSCRARGWLLPRACPAFSNARAKLAWASLSISPHSHRIRACNKLSGDTV